MSGSNDETKETRSRRARPCPTRPYKADDRCCHRQIRTLKWRGRQESACSDKRASSRLQDNGGDSADGLCSSYLLPLGQCRQTARACGPTRARTETRRRFPFALESREGAFEKPRGPYNPCRAWPHGQETEPCGCDGACRPDTLTRWAMLCSRVQPGLGLGTTDGAWDLGEAR